MSEERQQHIRYDGLDVIKLLAAFLVTFYHFQYLDFGFTAGVSYSQTLHG